MSACGKAEMNTTEESVTKETNDSNEDVNESDELKDVASENVTYENVEDKIVNNEKAYELKEEMKNADALQRLYQVDDLIFAIDGTMTFHDVIVALEGNDEEYIFEFGADVIYKASDDYKDKLAIEESQITGYRARPGIEIKKTSADGSEVPYVRFTFDNMTGKEAECLESTLVGISFVTRTERANNQIVYNLWLPGGIDYEDASNFTMDNASEIFTKAGYTECELDGNRISPPDGAIAIFCKDSDKDKYYFGTITNEDYFSRFNLDFSSDATDVGLEVPVIY